MSALLRQYFDIAFLMGKPQDLPPGETQMRIGIALALATYVAALATGFGLPRSLLVAVLDIGITGVVLRTALGFAGHPARFQQAFGGYCGAAAFVNAAAIPVYLGQSTAIGTGPSFADFVLLVWNLSLLGHVLRHTFGLRMATSILLAFLYVVVLTTALDGVLPSPAGLDDAGAITSSWSRNPGTHGPLPASGPVL